MHTSMHILLCCLSLGVNGTKHEFLIMLNELFFFVTNWNSSQSYVLCEEFAFSKRKFYFPSFSSGLLFVIDVLQNVFFCLFGKMEVHV